MERIEALITDPLNGHEHPVIIELEEQQITLTFPQAPGFNTESERFGQLAIEDGALIFRVRDYEGESDHILISKVDAQISRDSYTGALPAKISAAALAYSTSNFGSPMANRVMLAVHKKEARLYWIRNMQRIPLLSVEPDKRSQGYYVIWGTEKHERQHFYNWQYVEVWVEKVEKSIED